MHDNGEKIILDAHDQRVVGSYESFAYDEVPEVVSSLRAKAQEISGQLPNTPSGERDEAAATAMRYERFASGLGILMASRSVDGQ